MACSCSHPLHASDGEVYAAAQGPLTIAGYTAGGHGNSVQLNHPTVGRVPDGAIIERDASVDLSHLAHVSLLLREPDFSVARDAAASINKELGIEAARAIDGGRVEVATAGMASGGIPALLARIGDVSVSISPIAKVVINERTGTIVLGSDVSLGACSILQGSLTVDITTTFIVSQPAPALHSR